MPDKFDPYRERLVMETETEWSPECDVADEIERTRIALLMHKAPGEAAAIEYIRTHTGFCRRITVTPEDVERLNC
ncbi:MAG: hypothetical protein ACR2NU_15095 [Aeoliella sp.]